MKGLNPAFLLWEERWNTAISQQDFEDKYLAQLPETIEVTAWDLCGSDWWTGLYLAFTRRGRVGWEQAVTFYPYRSVKLSRLVPLAKTLVLQRNQWVKPETKLILKRANEQANI